MPPSALKHRFRALPAKCSLPLQGGWRAEHCAQSMAACRNNAAARKFVEKVLVAVFIDEDDEQDPDGGKDKDKSKGR
jgi:hypothetical protein